MPTPNLRLLIACSTLLLGGSLGSRAATPDFAGEIKPLFENYCYKCHANGKKKGNVALDTFIGTPTATGNDKAWSAVLENLRTGDMPPEDEKQPTPEQRQKLMKWIDLAVFSVDPDHPDPGRVTVRRLNRVEYNNTIRDLVGVDLQPADDFPADDSGYGFDDIGDVLSLSPVLFDRYLAAAEKVMSAAILNDHTPRPEKVPADLLKITGGPGNGSTPVSRKINEQESTLKIDLPVAGDYQLRIGVSAKKIGDQPTQMELKFDGMPVIGVQPFPGTNDSTVESKYTVKAPQAGSHTLSIRVANPMAKPTLLVQLII